jgi:hypothetical protein
MNATFFEDGTDSDSKDRNLRGKGALAPLGKVRVSEIQPPAV